MNTDTDVDHSLTVLKKVQKLIAENDTDLSISDLLDKAHLTESEYVEALETSCTGFFVVLQHEPNECCINNYNPAVMLAWQANMDIQFVLNAYACVMYVASYIMKTERSMGVSELQLKLEQTSWKNSSENLVQHSYHIEK